MTLKRVLILIYRYFYFVRNRNRRYKYLMMIMISLKPLAAACSKVLARLCARLHASVNRSEKPEL